MRKKFNPDTVNLIKEISNQYIDIYLIVKKCCPKNFTKDEIAIMFVKTEQMFNAYQCHKHQAEKDKNITKKNHTVKDASKSYQ